MPLRAKSTRATLHVRWMNTCNDAIDVVCDLILQPTFPEKELQIREKDVVLEEIKMYEDVPEDLIFDRFESIVYKNHTLGRPVIGFPETVRSFTRENLTDYIDTRYTPERTVIAVAGHANHDKVVRYVEKAFADTRRSAPAQPRTAINGYTPDEVMEHRSIQQAHLLLGARGFSMHDPKRIALALSVLNTILGGGMSSRLNQNIREKYGYCYNIYSFINLHSDTGDFGVYMGTDQSKVKHAEKLIRRELDKMTQKLVSSDRELNQAISQVKGALMLGLESMSNRMMRIARQQIYFGRYFTLDEIIETVEEVTAEQVRDVATELFKSDNFSRIVLLPASLDS